MSAVKSVWKGPALNIRLEYQNEIVSERRTSEMAFPVTLGRRVGDDGWATPPEDQQISGRHAEICIKRCGLFRRQKLYLRDLQSTNGIVARGVKVAEVELKDGVRVSMGNCTLVVEKDNAHARKPINRHHRLKQLTGPGAGRVIDLVQASTPIGREVPEGGIRCPSLLVSRHHADIICNDDGTCDISHVGENGETRVDGKPLEKGSKPCMLMHRDIISCADIQFQFLDKTMPDPFSWKKTATVAFVTVVCFLILRSVIDLFFPSAKSLMAEAKRYERDEQFNLALELLDQASKARGHEDYDSEIQRRKRDILMWKDTLRRWKQVKDMIEPPRRGGLEGGKTEGMVTASGERRQWVKIYQMLGELLSESPDRWAWNTTTAQKRKDEARILYELIGVFLEASSKMGGKFTDADLREFGDRRLERLVLEKCYVKVKDALARKDWTGDVHSGPLRGDMEEIGEAVKAVIRDLGDFERIVYGISSTDSPALQEVFARTADLPIRIARLEALVARETERNSARAASAKEAGRDVQRSDVVTRKCEPYIPVLRKFTETRRALESNCVALAQLKFGEMSATLPLPSEGQINKLPVFGDFSKHFREANKNVNGGLRSAVQGQIERLRRMGVGDEKTPECLAAFLDKATMAKVFACDTLVPGTPPPSLARSQRQGEFDRVLGVEEFGPFVADLDKEHLLEERGGKLPEPLLVQAIRLYRQLKKFRQATDVNPDIGYLISLDVKDGRNALHSFAIAALGLIEKMELLVDVWWGEKGGADNMRASLVAHAAAWALDEGRLDDEDRQEMEAEYRAWRDAMMRLDKRIHSHPEEVVQLRAKILSLGIPGNPAGSLPRHWVDSSKAAGGKGP